VKSQPGCRARSFGARPAALCAAACVALHGLSLGGCAVRETPPPLETQVVPHEAGSTLDIPCDPNRVLSTVCQKCHSASPQNGAPFPLVTYDDTHVVQGGKAIWQYMLNVVENGIMPLPPVEITAGDRDTLLQWLNAGAPARTASDTCSVVHVDGQDADVDVHSDSGADVVPQSDWDGDDTEAASSVDAGADPDAYDNSDGPTE
jgi:hypothetical protein